MNADFERFTDLMAEMISKYANELNFPETTEVSNRADNSLNRKKI